MLLDPLSSFGSSYLIEDVLEMIVLLIGIPVIVYLYIILYVKIFQQIMMDISNFGLRFNRAVHPMFNEDNSMSRSMFNEN